MRMLLSVLLVLLLVPTFSTVAPGPRLGSAPRMAATRVPLDAHDPTVRRVGRLTFLGGISLTSPDSGFGGFSSMTLERDRFTLLSDGGNIIDFRMDSRMIPQDVHFANLPDGPGTGWEKIDRDSESMALDPATGDRWVGFESYNAIWRYAKGFARAEASVRPKTMADWPVTGGAELLVRLRNGHFLTISETGRFPHSDDREAILFDRDPTIDGQHGFRFAYRPPAGYDPSDAVELPDGDLLVLNRRFALPYNFTAILTIVSRRAIRPGAPVSGKEIARFAAPLIHDNFEALAVTRQRGQIIVWMASDDNQSMLERSLLLKFRLEPASAADKPKARTADR
ncbi:esterase-like activity of phytase family protein [Sphingomonas koreensis]|nr:esterase-like activity of phytase family protein [Sphingomonas koreensis]